MCCRVNNQITHPYIQWGEGKGKGLPLLLFWMKWLKCGMFQITELNYFSPIVIDLQCIRWRVEEYWSQWSILSRVLQFWQRYSQYLLIKGLKSQVFQFEIGPKEKALVCASRPLHRILVHIAHRCLDWRTLIVSNGLGMTVLLMKMNSRCGIHHE